MHSPARLLHNPDPEGRALKHRNVLCEPATLSVTHIYEGENVVTGGPDGQAWVATFASHDLAQVFVNSLKAAGMACFGMQPVLPRRKRAH